MESDMDTLRTTGSLRPLSFVYETARAFAF